MTDWNEWERETKEIIARINALRWKQYRKQQERKIAEYAKQYEGQNNPRR